MNIQKELHQAANLIAKAKNIVLMPHARMDCDGMSASLALYLLLKKLGKNPTAVCGDPVPEVFEFLPSTQVFTDSMPHGIHKNKYLVTLDTKEKGFKDLNYSIEDGKVNIVLSSEEAPFEETDFSFIGSSIEPDLIITLDSGDTKQLGQMYTDNFDLFEAIPVINIDHHVSNTQFGDVNVVDFKSCSTTELVYKLLPLLTDEKLLDEDISTLILAGMLTDTGSFQHSNTTSASLDIAAELISHGARHQEIIKHLFKTKSLATLRVWGQVLTKLQNDPIYRIVWSSVSRNDLDETQAHSDETEGLIDELMATTSGTELVLLVKEREDNIITTSVRSSSAEVDSVAFTSLFGGGGHKQAAGFKIRERGGKSFDEIVSDIIFEAKKFQAQRLSIEIPKRDLISAIKESKEEKTIDAESAPADNLLKTSASLVPPFPYSQDHIAQKENIAIEQKESMTDSPKDVSQKESIIPSLDHGIDEKNKNILSQENIENTFKEEQIKENTSMVLNDDPFVNQGDDEKEEHDQPVLSPEEKSYLENSKEYKISDPEKEIEKKEEGNYIDDFADFLAKADEEDPYLTESETSHISNVSKNTIDFSQANYSNSEEKNSSDPDNAASVSSNPIADFQGSIGNEYTQFHENIANATPPVATPSGQPEPVQYQENMQLPSPPAHDAHMQGQPVQSSYYPPQPQTQQNQPPFIPQAADPFLQTLNQRPPQ